ncbi:cysteine desulfurase family protein [Sorangium cellulosum]|uniref:Cysteine desulfurase n=1 Tax=Sorangium cellulosum TaxID=56 RepID=A0A150Q4L7_SORCE|nr:cysteine desulfurase family protein [Sorangium cellulosum]KYF62909.1 cysteine desulfurase [Sorangium cellulosum]
MRSAAGLIYLDWNATTPPHPEVLAAMQAAAEVAWANPASVHGPGRRARAFIEQAREAAARLTGFDARDVTLTSGGTEANNLALWHAFGGEASGAGAAGAPAWGRLQGALVVSRIEHPSVTRAAEALAGRGVEVAWVDPEPSGRVAPEALAAAIDRAAAVAPVRLLSLQAVNHETGVVQPVAEAAALAHARGARLHVDAVQAVGRLPPEAWAGADLVSVAAHKIRGPKGIGALAARPGIRLRPVLLGGAQERGLRPGTQDPIAAAGFAVAARRALDAPARYAALAPLRDRLEAELLDAGRAAGGAPLRNGQGARAPHVANLSWPGWRGDELCAALDLEGVAVSSGSACSAGTAEPSPVLTAMLGAERAASAVRFSIGEETTEGDIAEAVRRVARVLTRLRPLRAGT